MKEVHHPMQPIVNDGKGVHRFKKNAIVEYLLEQGPFDLNHLALCEFSDEDQEQFAQLIGYSVSGACDLDYMSDKVCERALKASRKLAKRETT